MDDLIDLMTRWARRKPDVPNPRPRPKIVHETMEFELSKIQAECDGELSS